MFELGALCGLVLGMTTGQACSGAIFSLTGDWSDASNPNGVWSYNKGNHPLPHVDDWLGQGPAWAQVGSSNPGHVPAIMGVSDSVGAYVSLHAWDHLDGLEVGSVNVSWTSPGAGTVDIAGQGWSVENGRLGGIWSLWIDHDPLTSGFLWDGDAYDRNHPLSFTEGSGGAAVLNDIPVLPGTVIRLQWDKMAVRSSLFQGVMTVEFDAVAVPEPVAVGGVVAAALLAWAVGRRRRMRASR